MCEPRNDFADCSPKTQRIASATFDLPQPFGPTIHVTPSPNLISALSANDLKPNNSTFSKFNVCYLLPLVLLSFTTFFAPDFTGFCCFLLAFLLSAKTSFSYATFAQTCWASFLLLPQPLATSLPKI